MSPAASFPARFRGMCGECDGIILQGQMIVATENGYIHETCPSIPLNETPWASVTCIVCFQQKSVNGSCGCDG